MIPLLLLACAPKNPVVAAPPTGGWQTTTHANHALIGSIWSPAQGAFIAEAQLLSEARTHAVVLLGEKHDNADHHRLQARLTAGLASAGTPVVFEMLNNDASAALTGGNPPTNADEFSAAVGWEDSGWPEFSLYRPVLEAVYAAEASPTVGHPTRAVLKQAMMEGLDTLAPEQLDDLQLSRTEDDATIEDYSEEIRRSHCGHAPESIVPAMVLGQRLKDAWMARAVRQAAESGPVILIAGGGHVRSDRAVPRYLEDSYSVLLVEIPRGGERPELDDYSGVADAVWFTPRVDDRDPCEVFAEQLRNLGPVE